MQKAITTILTTLTLATATVLTLTSCGQMKIDWTELTSFLIYDTLPQDKDIISISDNDIQGMNFIETDLVEAKRILVKAESIGNKFYLWKGHNFAMATFTNGQKRRIKISVYGGFFMDLTTNEYYKFKYQARKDWDKFYWENYSKLDNRTDNICDKCDIDKLKPVNEHLDDLTYNILKEFLCTFDTSCAKNVEYSEWSNELLFKVLDKSPSIFFEVIAKEQVNNEIILNEIKSPLLDINLQNIYDKIKSTSGQTDVKAKYLNAIIISSEKGGQQIKR